jgi:hypothetical protein
MQLFDSWNGSRDFFEFKSLSMFVLVTLKLIKSLYTVLFKYFLIPIMCVICAEMICLASAQELPACWWILWFLRLIFLFLIYLAVRPSVGIKNWHYYWSYKKHALYILPMLGLIFLVLNHVGYWWWSMIMSVVTFTVLFFVDSVPGCINLIMANVRALKMVLYNLPSVLMISLVLVVFWSLYMVCVQLFRVVIAIPVLDASFLFIPFEACVVSNLYIMWLHKQFDIYFEQPK